MYKGKLVNPILGKSHMRPGPYVVIRSSYELPASHVIRGTKVTTTTLCVDLLTPDGEIIKGVACSILEYA
tara:strand:+ start:669 stop:878 length:210 start_codon:yes stop_codon:yes gene_type:complete